MACEKEINVSANLAVCPADLDKVLLTNPLGTEFLRLEWGKLKNCLLTDVVDLRAYGAVPDGIAESTAALIAAKAVVPEGALIWLKNRDTGIYKFDNTDPALFDGVLFYIEEGVTVSLTAGNAVTIKSVTPFTINWEVLGDQKHRIFPESWNPIKDVIEVENLKDNVAVREVYDANLFTDEKGYATWPNDATIASIPANLTIDSVKQFTLTGIGGGALRVARADAIAGATLTGCARNSTSGFGIMWVENAYGVCIATNGGDFNIKKFGDATTEIAYSLPAGYVRALADNGVYENYHTNKAVCSIKIHEDGKGVEFLHNGVNMSGHIITLGGLPIVKWGFGGYNATTVSWYDFVLEYNKKKEPYEDIQIQIFGDSQSVEYVGASWMTYMQRVLNNSYGNRITSIENYAVSGQAMAAQKAIFDATTHYGVSIFLIGTNDIQGQTSIPAFLASLDDILTQLDFDNATGGTNGVIDAGKNRLLLVIPPMYFSQDLNNFQGQASANYEKGGAYRMAIIRWAVENDVTIVDLMTAFGATTMASNVMRDDIHFSDLGAAIAAREIAKQLLILKSQMTANKVLVGDAKSSLHFIKNAPAPVDAVTPVEWIDIYRGGQKFKMPLFQ